MNVSYPLCDEVITWNCPNCNNMEEHFHINHYFFSNSIDNSIPRICQLLTYILIHIVTVNIGSICNHIECYSFLINLNRRFLIALCLISAILPKKSRLLFIFWLYKKNYALLQIVDIVLLSSILILIPRLSPEYEQQWKQSD